MCVVSLILDDWRDKHFRPFGPYNPSDPLPDVLVEKVTKKEFEEFREEMRKELESLKVLIKAAKKYDEETGQPDCEMKEKVAMLKKFAELLGVDIAGVFND